MASSVRPSIQTIAELDVKVGRRRSSRMASRVCSDRLIKLAVFPEHSAEVGMSLRVIRLQADGLAKFGGG